MRLYDPVLCYPPKLSPNTFALMHLFSSLTCSRHTSLCYFLPSTLWSKACDCYSLWNVLPSDTLRLTTLFRGLLKCHLIREVFPNHTIQNSTSLTLYPSQWFSTGGDFAPPGGSL